MAANVLHLRSTGDSLPVLPGGNAFRKRVMKLTKSLLERVQPQTTAAMLLLMKFHCLALYFANALL